MFLHCQYCPFAATCCKKLSAFSILNSYNIYRLFPVTHADTYTLTDTQVHLSLSLARYPFAGRGNIIFSLSIKTPKAILLFMFYSPLPPFPSQQLIVKLLGVSV